MKLNNFSLVRKKSMDSLSNRLQELAISNNCFNGEDLSNEQQFFEDSIKEIEPNFSDLHCSFYSGRRIMCFSINFGHFPTEYQVRKILADIERSFAKIKKLQFIGWCASYLIDKRVHQKFMAELSYLNILPNCNRRQGDKTEFIPFSLCYFFNCSCLIEDGSSKN